MRPAGWALLGALLCGAPALALGSDDARPAAAGERSTGYQIGPEDLLQILVWKNEVLSRTVPVRPDGMISLPLLNDVQAAGLTPLELRAVLIKKLAEFIPDPEVSVIVTDVRSLKVSVIGQVARPGRYEFRSWATVMDVLATAGGLSEFAAKSRIAVFRPDGRSVKRIPFNYEKLGAKEDAQLNFFVRPGDLVFVP